MGVIRRTLTDADQVTQLIRQGANPSCVMPRLPRVEYALLSLVIDDVTDYTIPSIWAQAKSNGWLHPVALPRWPSSALQDAVMTALVDGGADINAAGADRDATPIRVAVPAANMTAVDHLLHRGVQLHGLLAMRLPEWEKAYLTATADCERQLLAICRRLIQHDSTLAADEYPGGFGLAHSAAIKGGGRFSQSFINQYLDLLVANGADIRAADNGRNTPLQVAACWGSPYVTNWLCRHVPADDVNRGMPNSPTSTPLAMAAYRLDSRIRLLEGNGIGEDGKEDIRTTEIPNLKTVICTLLRAGAAPSIARMPTQEAQRIRQLVLTEYATVLNGLSDVTMSAINAALAPQRDHSMLLARLLPLAPHNDGEDPAPSPLSVGPHEAEAIGWKIGAFLHEPSAAAAAIDEYLIGDSTLRRRVKAAMAHFVKSAATRTSSNREVIGDMANVGGVVVRVPLQCCAVRGRLGGPHRLLGVREVVHKARLDEAASHGVIGVVKGFNEHPGDGDCVFEWQQLGYIHKAIGLFVALGIE
ncbi:unnamed protein product [Vitrella brassicaformis CCMP3155]|uniref:Uncharacterized protein n=1 Tax=Vitrella brassicaformis (strain CCMP3155) TaxID=1169540 RepID=A0A0G4E8D9_VITBC|nr:unnamed protein product [Vitrella brassicaformis CCMP3155]|eukprot:CEL91982.1 unnamed protein product [Vitrella brassicaformis CCMP3155]